MADLVDRLGTVGLWGEAREEILRLRAELTFATQERNAYQGAIDVACKERDRLRAECLRLSHAEAEAMSVVLSLEGQLERLRAEVAALKSELKEISIALNDPADNLIRTTAECVSELRKDAKRYLWLRDSAPEKWAPWADEREDTTPKEIDAAIDAALGEEKS